ncbi:MAG: thiosulfate oxidation carrier protein SoxY [Rhodobacteraceae bacterium]|nr:thiosulfate oxidation carrier protein SoxY [Paracoccaceae bacterium]
MNLSRRNILAIGGAAVTVSLIPVDFAMATPEAAAEALNAFTGGAAVTDGGIDLVAPEIAENGNTVPISVSAPGAVAILVLSEGNPSPGVATFTFGEGAAGTAATRIRLAGTQNVLAVAKMADGSFVRAARAVKVTIGGCGG